MALALAGGNAPDHAVAAAGDQRAPLLTSLPGQIVVVTVNAKQRRTLDVERFQRLLDLTLAMRNRVPALNGGSASANTAADLIVLNEMTQSNAEILKRLVNQRSRFHYELMGPDDSRARFLYNSTTLSVSQAATSWNDPCLDGLPPGEEHRIYQKAIFIENETGTLFSLAGIHIEPKYPQNLECTRSNIEALRLHTEADPGPVILAGDFNRRAMSELWECDPDERSAPTEWWLSLTQPAPGARAYTDAVQTTHRRSNTSLVNDWTHEQKAVRETCAGDTRIRRSRIDYIFANGFQVAEADADHPGWSGGEPGKFSDENGRYSDHRFVWARLTPGSLPRLDKPDAQPGAGGDIALTWPAGEGVNRYVVFRGIGRKPLQIRGLVDTAAFVDSNTVDGKKYRYAIAPVGSTGAYGWESRTSSAVAADAKGPGVVDVDPDPGKSGVGRGAVIRVRFNERVDASSVHGGTISLYRGGRKVGGTVTQVEPRVLRFKPHQRLPKTTRFNVIARPVTDRLGNIGDRFDWSFMTGKK